MLKITDQARDMLKEIFKYQNAQNIRVFFGGFGWGGPQVGLSLDEPKENDIIETINEIKVAIQPNMVPFLEGLSLVYNPRTNGIVLIGNNQSC